jgi:hypothetical protein
MQLSKQRVGFGLARDANNLTGKSRISSLTSTMRWNKK